TQQHHLVKPLPCFLPLARFAADAMIAKAPQRLRQPHIVGRNHAAFSGGQVFNRMKAEHGHVSNTADAFPFVFGAQRMAGVFNQEGSVLCRQLSQFIQRSGMSRIVDRENGFRVGRELSGDFPRIKVQRVPRDVGEHRRRALIQNAVGGRTERHGGGDRLIPGPQSGGERRTVQGGCARTETDRVPRPDPSRKPFFELANLRPRSQPVRLQNFNHRLHIVVIQALPPVRQQFPPHGRTPMDGERFQLCEERAHAKRRSELPPRRSLPALPTPPVDAASASVRSCRSNNGSPPAAAWRSPSFPISTTDATAESRTCLRFRAFAVTRLPRPALHAASLRDESRWSLPGIRERWSPPGPAVACWESWERKSRRRASVPGSGSQTSRPAPKSARIGSCEDR